MLLVILTKTGAYEMTTKDTFQEFSTVKYEITSNFAIQGVVEKSDVVGAIFGQTEGLLGQELDIRDLQKSGRIGRINVEMESQDGKTKGKITIPSSLDRVETAILAATIETVDRVGPCAAEFKLISLEDVRKRKRDKIIGRATELLQKWDLEVSPETQEITEKVAEATVTEDIIAYGNENLPAGPEIDVSDTIIICEGRADVLSLLGIGVLNAIATNGTKVPKTIADISRKKTTIAFLDGDRGGDMILNELLQVGKIDFVARAPDGKEVEDLTKKELLKALQQKVPYINNKPANGMSFNKKRDNTPSPKSKPPKRSSKPQQSRKSRFNRRNDKPRGRKKPSSKSKPKANTQITEVPDVLRNTTQEMLGTTKARFYDENLQLIKEVPTSLIVEEMQKESGKIKNILFDGIVSQRLLDISSKEKVEIIIGTRIGNVKKPGNLKVFCIEQFA